MRNLALGGDRHFKDLPPLLDCKFLMRKDLDDSELKPEDEQVHEEWQKRGLSRGKLRKHVMKMMDWDNIPEVAVDEILSQIREKISS